MFFFATADAGLAAEEAARDTAKAASGAAVPTGTGGEGGEERAAALHQHLLVEFALSLLQGALKKGLINPRAPDAGEWASLPGRIGGLQGWGGVCNCHGDREQA